MAHKQVIVMSEGYYVKDGDDYAPLSDDKVVLSKSELETTYVPKERFGQSIQDEIQRRFSNHVHKDKAHEDETVIARVLESHGGQSVDQDKLRSHWESAHLKPLGEKLTQAEERAQRLEERVKFRELGPVLEEAGFDKSFVTRPEPGKPSPAEVYFGDKFGLDDNGSLTVNGTSTSPQAFASELASNDAYKIYLKQEARNASTAGRPGQDNSAAAAKSGLRKRDMTGPEQADYIAKHGYYSAKGDGIPFMNLPN